MESEAATLEALQLRLEVDGHGTKRYFNDKNELHRVYGPSIVCADGSISWWINGKLHRLNGPAIEFKNGDKVWFLNGKRHRTDGPAIIFADRSKEYWLDNKELTKEEFLSHTLCTIK